MILIVGATGDLGGAITRTLLDGRQPVRILVRPGSDYHELVAAGAEAVTGDLKDAASLRTACEGIDAVVTTATATARGGDDTVASVDRAGTGHLIDAAAAGVRHLVYVSALGAAPEAPMALLQAKGESEQRLRDSSTTWTILQPNGFMEKLIGPVVGQPALAGDPVTLAGEGRRHHSLVSMREVAAYAVAALHHPEAANRTLLIRGPEPISWRDTVAAFEAELGTQIAVNTVPLGRQHPACPTWSTSSRPPSKPTTRPSA